MSLNRNEKIGVFIAVVLAFIFIFVSAGLFRGESNNTAGSGSLGIVSDLTNDSQNNNKKNSLTIEDLIEGSGDVATAGSVITAHYIGTLSDGTKFDSSLDRGEPFQFLLGTGQVIKGWDQGIEGMKVGGVRQLTIPPELAYGNAQAGPIPPNSTLIFQVELLGVDTPSQ